MRGISSKLHGPGASRLLYTEKFVRQEGLGGVGVVSQFGISKISSVSEDCFNSADPKEKPYSAVDYLGQHCS